MDRHTTKTREIIDCRNDCVSPGPSGHAEFYFQITADARLFPQADVDTISALRFLGQRITHKPEDLRSHVQRIHLLVRAKDGPELFGALVDLLIVLRDKGPALKQRCLAQADPFLSRNAKTLIKKHLENGLQPHDPALSRVPNSVLSLGFSGSSVIVDKTQATIRSYQTPLEEAMARLEYGQLDEARLVLEEALRECPDDPRIAQELLGLYRHQRDTQGFESMRDWLMQYRGCLPAGWTSSDEYPA